MAVPGSTHHHTLCRPPRPGTNAHYLRSCYLSTPILLPQYRTSWYKPNAVRESWYLSTGHPGTNPTQYAYLATSAPDILSRPPA
eukprot:884941-Rhodomonas_salina.5